MVLNIPEFLVRSIHQKIDVFDASNETNHNLINIKRIILKLDNSHVHLINKFNHATRSFHRLSDTSSISRKRNIIIKGLKDGNKLFLEYHAKQILQIIDSNIHGFRKLEIVHHYKHNGTVGIKVQLESVHLVKRLLRHRNKLKLCKKYSSLCICDDKSPQELAYLNNLRSELESRIQNGESNITIKFKNGIPHIVQQEATNNNNNTNISLQEINALYTNIASLPAKFLDFSSHISTMKKKPSLIILSETWLTNQIPNLVVPLQDYTLHRNDRVDGRSGGVAVYTNDSFFNKCKIKVTVLVKPFFEGFESLWLQLKSRIFSVLCICVYRKCNNSNKNDTIFYDEIVKEQSNYNNVILVGDFNLPKINWSQLSASTKQESEIFIEKILSSGFIQYVKIVKEPTRIREGNTPSLLDLLLSKNVTPYYQM